VGEGEGERRGEEEGRGKEIWGSDGSCLVLVPHPIHRSSPPLPAPWLPFSLHLPFLDQDSLQRVIRERQDLLQHLKNQQRPVMG
jgi:hypothetical protein